MDRSFLSQPEVIAASRKFVCVRLMTYENQAEADFLKGLVKTRSGQLENSVFAILSPDGKRTLNHASRSTRHVYSDASQMAQDMNRIAAANGSKTLSGSGTALQSRQAPPLPTVANVHLAIDVAASDRQPLALLVADSADHLTDLKERLRSFAWQDELIGHFIYAATTNDDDLKSIKGLQPGNGLYIIQPNRFGTGGEVIAQAAANASQAQWVETLRTGIIRHRPLDESHHDHVSAGHELGVFWNTPIPVSDPMEQGARERGRSGRGP